ncbi:MAG: radical SAM protein [Gammaproteobacteria bacterium]|jgi:8-oxo-dGTP pyrophosphatase MutT (NUDIX family)/organic radical activating enzyme
MVFNYHENILVNRQYGKWNAICAICNAKTYVFYQNHAKMFPEQLDEWIKAIKSAYFNQTLSPIRLDIDVTSNCSNNCIMCFSKKLNSKLNSTLPLDQLKSIFDDFKNLGGKSVRLTGGGDPLNHPKIIEIIKYLADLKLKITVETNGDLLQGNIIKTIANYVHHLRISVDSFDNNSRYQVHKSNDKAHNYENLIKKIKTVHVEAIKFNREQELFIGATFIMLPENYRNISKFMCDMYDVGANWIAIRKNICRKVYDDHPEIIPFVENQINIFKQNIKDKRDFIIEKQYGISFKPKDDFNFCWISRLRFIILADLSLQLCCLARNGIMPKAKIGTINDKTQSIATLLKNNSHIQDFQKNIPKNCQFCIDKENNISFANIVALLKQNANFNFTKAHVYLTNEKSNDKACMNANKIMQIPLTKKQYERYMQGDIVNVASVSDKKRSGVVIVIIQNGKYLLVKQNKKPYKDHWAPIHGKIEQGETEEAAVIREAHEELGLAVIPIKKIGTSNADYDVDELHWWIAENNGCKNKYKIDKREIAEYKYFSPENLLTLQLFPTTKKMFLTNILPAYSNAPSEK